MQVMNRETGSEATAIVMRGRVKVPIATGHFRQLPPGTAIVDYAGRRRFIGPIELRDQYALVLPTEHFTYHRAAGERTDVCGTTRKGQTRR